MEIRSDRFTEFILIEDNKQNSSAYRGTKIAISVGYLITYLPIWIRNRLGRVLGRQLQSRKKILHIVETNISRCFPELDGGHRQALISDYFQIQGIDLIETLTIWCRNGYRLVDNRVNVRGLHHLRDALAREKGIILLASHFGNVDMGAMLMAYIGDKNDLYDFSVTYREQPNPVLNRFMVRGREQYYNKVIPVDDSRQIVNELKKGRIVWYAPDMNVEGKNSVFIDFLGVQAATTTAISRLSRITGALVVPYMHRRVRDGGYEVEIFPALRNFPSVCAPGSRGTVPLRVCPAPGAG